VDVRTLCLGVLSFGDTTGYGIRKAVGDWFGHFAQASLGAIYPALAKAVARGEVEVIGPADPSGDRPPLCTHRSDVGTLVLWATAMRRHLWIPPQRPGEHKSARLAEAKRADCVRSTADQTS
jgi:hypothetical protein